MKIVFLINEFEKGGAERVVSYLIKHIPDVASNIQPILFLLEKSDFAYPIPNTVQVYTASKYHSSNIFKFIKLPLLAFRLKKFVKKNNINTVISFLSRANYVNTMSKRFGSDHRCLISERTTPSVAYNSHSIVSIINRFLLSIFYPVCQRIIAVSKGVKQDLIENFKIPDDNISVIYNPYNISTITRYSTEKVGHEWFENTQYKTILTVGRLEKPKNQVLLIKAFKLVNEIMPETRLLILGEGRERKNLARLIKNLDLELQVQMPGQNNNPYAFLFSSDLFVLSSDFEGFPNVIVEAMICGCPVVSTNCKSGPNEIIENGVNGILVPVGDMDELKEAIIKILQDKQLSKKLKKKAKEKIQKYEINKIVNQYLKILT